MKDSPQKECEECAECEECGGKAVPVSIVAVCDRCKDSLALTVTTFENAEANLNRFVRNKGWEVKDGEYICDSCRGLNGRKRSKRQKN